MKSVSILIVRLYQKMISPLLGANCRFYPTCSEYLCRSLEEYGFWKGLWRGMIRICKCHPLHPGGYDPVK